MQQSRNKAVQAKQAPLLSQGFTTANGGTVHGGLAPIQQSHGAKVTAEWFQLCYKKIYLRSSNNSKKKNFLQ